VRGAGISLGLGDVLDRSLGNCRRVVGGAADGSHGGETGGHRAASDYVMALLFGHRASAPIGSAAAGTGFREFVLGVSAALFAFGGWHMVTYTAGEMRDPRKTIPKALLIGVAIVTVCYLALNATYLYLLPLARVTASTRVAADAAFAVAGARGAAVISALVILSVVACLTE